MDQKVNWVNLALEFSTVLIGILIAFQLNRCSVDSSNAHIIDRHIEYIVQENQINRKIIESALKQAQRNQVKLETLIELIKKDGEPKLINQLSIELLEIGGAYIKKNAYNSLVTTGDIRFMEDFKLKSETINLYEFYIWMQSVQQAGFDSYNSQYFSYINENFDLLNRTVQSKEIYTSKKFRNSIGSYRYFLEKKIIKYKEGLERIDKYLKLLESGK